MVIVQVNNRFFVEVNGNRLHILNWNSLRWNLQYVFKINKTTVRQIGNELMEKGRVEIVLQQRKAA